MPIKQSFSGLGPNTVLPYLAAVDPHSSLEQRPSKPVTMCVCSESPFLRTSANISTFLLYVQSASIGSVRSAKYIDHSTDSTAALVHALIASRVDYCNTVLAEAPRTITDRFQRVLNAAARVVIGTRKFDRGLSQLLHTELHWLNIPQRVQYKLGVTVHRCLQNKAP